MKKRLWILVVVFGVMAVLFFTRQQNEKSSVVSDERGFYSQDVAPYKKVEQSVLGVSPGKPVVKAASVEPESARELTLSDEVAKLLSSETSFAARAQFIKELSRSLLADDITALREFLSSSSVDHPKMKPMVLNSLKNDILEVLMDQHKMPEGLGQQVVDLFNDPSSDYMWREYCLQFMEPLWEKMSEDGRQRTEGGEQRAGELLKINQQSAIVIQQCLFSALDLRSEDLAGTALLGLNRLAKKQEEFDRDEILEKAVEMTEDTRASDRCRLTALRVAASGASTNILLVARELAVNAKTDLLRGAAIATLGDFAEAQDRELLERLAATGNRQITTAAKAALKKFQAGLTR